MTRKETQDKWLYKYADDEKYRKNFNYLVTDVRYILGEKLDNGNKKSLICIGVNPSTATPNSLDPTLTRVRKYAEGNGYGAWYMINIYPQRATNPNNMHQDTNYDMDLHENNLKAIKELLKEIDNADIWCAWGGIIHDSKRKFLSKLLIGGGGIEGLITLFVDNPKYELKKSGTTQDGHPSHPLARKVSENLTTFTGLEEYKEQLTTL